MEWQGKDGRKHVIQGFTSRLAAISIVTMIYTSPEVVRKILRQDDFPKDIYIDNDYEVIVPLSEFIQLGMPMA